MTDETPPPTPLPPAAQPPYPPHPAPHAATQTIPVAKKTEPAANPGLGGLGVTLIGGALAATVGLLVALPLLARRKAAATGRKPGRRTTTRRSAATRRKAD